MLLILGRLTRDEVSRATVAVNDFDRDYAGLLRVANFGQEMVASLVDGGLGSNIESFE
jgi:hypothetical protein